MSLFPAGSSVRIEHGKPWKGSITMTGVVKDWSDGELVVERTFTPHGRFDSLGDQKRPGDHGLVEIVDGGWVLRRVYFRANGRRIGELFNVQTPVQLQPGVVRYTDLEIDVVRHGDGRIEVVDEDDLTQAVALGGITPELAERAREIAYRLAEILAAGGDWREADAPFRERRAVTGRPRSGSPGGRSRAPARG